MDIEIANPNETAPSAALQGSSESEDSDEDDHAVTADEKSGALILKRRGYLLKTILPVCT